MIRLMFSTHLFMLY